ncbi:MAG: DUF4252 domain-containing protein [Acidobacteria bacterium]|uniref:DUF4252 domain-containing protein n=1 Tax=Candidatus Polarisedimenticola svalbardensis TaxID=2886004 RepID=A0A8J6Y0R0_9BACT|nr:DUF4252 domain-containing protein [Candidatus Polarisedimenticola svalbardensis]
MKIKKFTIAIGMVVCLLAVAGGLSPVNAGNGFVDPEPFIDLGGEDDLTLEISISGALLKMISAGLAGADKDLADTVAGLHSIHAVILTMDTEAKQLRGQELLRATEKRLRRGAWDRIARVNDDEGNLSVWIFGTEETVDGVTVLIRGKQDGELVFVNIDGIIDLSKLEELGESLNLPGLDNLKD